MNDRRILVRGGIGALLAVLLALVAAVLPALPAHAAEADTIHSLVNQARAANGQAALTRNADMDRVAAEWAQQMADSGTMSHNPSYAAQIPGGWVKVGENVAQGQPSGAAMHDAWMASSGHRANILGDFTDIGIAFLSANGTTWGVEVFAAYPGQAASAPPTAAPSSSAPPAPAPAPPAAAPAPRAPAPPAERPAPADDPAPATEPTAEATAEPTPEPTPTATPRPGASTWDGTRSADAGPAAAEARAESSPWSWIAFGGSAVLVAVPAVLLVLRRRGLIGPPSGRHADR